jgi:ABC-2 type transport system ATP-binding protein
LAGGKERDGPMTLGVGDSAAIRMTGVDKQYGDQRALEAVDWEVPRGSIYGVVGANGAGKTTLLRLALGLMRPENGSVTVLGTPIAHDPDPAWIRTRVHYVASGRSSIPPLRVAEWLRYAALAYPRWDAERANRFVDALGIPPGRAIRDLSQGQRTALDIAVAAAAHPDLLLLDEPTNDLDVVVKAQVIQLLLDMAAAEGTTLVLATHHIDDVERVADHLAVLYAGRIVLATDVDGLKARIRRLQVVLPDEAWFDTLARVPAVVGVERHGRVALVTVDGSVDAFADACRAAGAPVVEPVEMDLTEVVRWVLRRAGYGRDQLRWTEG